MVGQYLLNRQEIKGALYSQRPKLLISIFKCPYSFRRMASCIKKFFFRKSSNDTIPSPPSRDKSSQKGHFQKFVLNLFCGAHARTPNRQPPKNFSQPYDAENNYFQKAHSLGSLLHRSTNVSSKDFDPYIDGEKEQETSSLANNSDGVSWYSFSAEESKEYHHEQIPGLGDSDLELLRKFKEAEQRAVLPSEELEESNFLLGRGLSVHALTEEKVEMDFEVSSILRDQVAERLGELAETNVSLQMVVSELNKKETDNKSQVSFLEKQLEDSTRKTEASKENQNLMQQISQLQQKYRVAEYDSDFFKKNYKEKVKECEDLHGSIARLQRTCNEQEKTIDGLRGFVKDVAKKSPAKYDNQLKRLQMEQLRLVGSVDAPRKDLLSCRLEIDSLRHEIISLLDHLRGLGKEGGFSAFKLDQELCSRVSCLENQALGLLQESSQLGGKLLEYAKGNVKQTSGMGGQFLIECNVKIQGFKRGIENLSSSLLTVSSVINEKSCPVNSDFHQQNAQKPDELKQLELKGETLLTTELREKLCSKERDIEQLHAELAAAVRGNDILKCEAQNALDTISCANDKMKDFELQMMKKEEHMNQLQNELQECMKERDQLWEDVKQYSKLLYSAEERDKLWESVKQYSELLYSENNSLKQKVKVLEEDVLLKEGQITILKDSIGNNNLGNYDSIEFLILLD